MCPVGVIAGAVGYSATSILLKNIISVRPNDIKVGMAAMIDNEIVRVDTISFPTIGISRGCADTVPAVHQDGALIWFFTGNIGTDSRTYVASDTVAVKLLPYSVASASVPVEQSPPHDITFNWRHARPYPPGNVKCEGSAWYNSIKEMALGADSLVWTWAHRDRILQADQLVPHGDGDIGPEPGTTYTVKVFDADNVLVRTVTGITAATWTYTRTMAEADGHVAAEAFVELYSVRAGFQSLQGYRTAIRLIGGSATIVDIGSLGWPGTKTNCGATIEGMGNIGTSNWDDFDIGFDGTESEWRNTPVSPITYEHTAVDMGALGEYRISLPSVGAGTITAEVATSVDGITYTTWAAPSGSYVTTRYVKARFTVSGTDPLLVSAKISYFRRS